MKEPEHPETKPMRALRRAALRYPEAEEGTSCNKSAFRARNKAFLFLGVDEGSYNVMVKLRDSLAEASRLEKKKPRSYTVGGGGWVKATFGRDESPPPGLLERWIGESYRLLVHKELVALLPGQRDARSEKPAQKKGKRRPTSR
jgi:YjbR protein